MKQKVFITKYALTSGIIECEMDVKITDTNKSCHGKPPGFTFITGFYNNDFWTSKQDALNHCEVLRRKKIASIEKQHKKILNLKF